MILQISSTKSTGITRSTPCNRTQQNPLKKRIKFILSQRWTLTIMLGLMFANILMTSLHLTLTDTSCVSCYHDEHNNYHPPIHRYFPRIIHYTLDDFSNMTQYETAELMRFVMKRRYVTDMGNAKSRRIIAQRDEIDLDIVEDEKCQLRSGWQRTSFPTCNIVHEFDGTKPWSRIILGSRHRRQKLYRIIGNGFWRDVWLVNHEHGANGSIPEERGIFKTIRYHHSFTPRNFDRMRRDGVTMERLTKSPFIINIYSFCGTSSISEYGDGGNIPDALWPSSNKLQNSTLTKISKLRIATQAAIALATVHNIDGDGYPTIAHTDIMPAQFIKVNNTYKLNDFNRARFIAYTTSTTTTTTDGNYTNNIQMCPYQIGSNPGRNRSPEEYNYEPQTEKVDVYSLGNIFYMLLQGEWPFYDVPQEIAMELVRNGTRPSIYSDLWYSTDPIDIALKEAMIMCHEHSATERASARDVEQYLIRTMRVIDPEQLDTWGVT